MKQVLSIILSILIFSSLSSQTWIQKQKLVADDRQVEDRLGFPAVVSGTHAIAGSYSNNLDVSGNNPIQFAGAAYFLKGMEMGDGIRFKKPSLPTGRAKTILAMPLLSVTNMQ